ncbi:DUF3995 domain-containing protein [Leucobacter coleopterorum]|uniref:DUF3995 domain-containing protein n=1 Tax=Leucobacter coleopterorum TaxID=2714933 RepID=A0ABX6JX44_9MICO|nr:DUF3995 domain-containing protein [Leucobacter coleopterorum]QIM18158.1 DUF3995 domain-containing protein [Leucobacter coleopterorum]
MGILRRTARSVGSTGLLSVGALHLVWASGSTWPAKSPQRLAEAVVGNAKAMPGVGPTAGVAAAAIGGGLIAGGALGEGRAVVALRRVMGLGLLARAVVNEELLMDGLGLPASGKRFKKFDQQYYRPLCAVLGIAVLLGSRDRKN